MIPAPPKRKKQKNQALGLKNNPLKIQQIDHLDDLVSLFAQQRRAA